RDEDVELVLDIGDEIEHGEAVPLEVLGEACRLGDRGALLVEGRDQLGDCGIGLLAVGHAGLVTFGLVSEADPLSQRNGARMGRFYSHPCSRYQAAVSARPCSVRICGCHRSGAAARLQSTTQLWCEK